MQTTKLKTYAPKARRDFIAAVTRRAASFGLSAKGISPIREEGEVVVIEGQAYPKRVGAQRARLAERIRRQGFEQVMEAAAYTWFNRFAAIRFMELHGYLDHSFRVLSHPAGGALPEILEQAQHVDLPGLDRQRIIAQKMDGTQDEALYRDLLLAQCRALHRAMPFLFERVDDETELLLPDSLLQTDSPIRELVTAIPEEDWQAIEIIGWLYQFYISEKKDQVIGKVVKSEDIPAATQLFTPNWIVQYLVQNSVGRLWLMANPTSTLASEWPYYIQPAHQTPEVQAQLDALIQTRIREDGDALNPESITVLDPACGSGHILVVAYDVLKAIYLERGFRLRDIPRLILEKNLYGLDIDDRAAQMAGFALLMKARADDRRLLNDPDNPPKLNVLSLQESKGLNYEELSTHLAPFGVQRAIVSALIETFEHTKTFGSLIQIPCQLKTHLEPLAQVLELADTGGDMYGKQAAQDLQPFVKQAQVLAMQFDAVVANPPYMGNKGMNEEVKEFVKVHYSDTKSDLCVCFIERSYSLAKNFGFVSMITMQSWMFLLSFQSMRQRMIGEKTIQSMAHIGFNSFPSLNSKIAVASAFCFVNTDVINFAGKFIDLNSASPSADKEAVFLNRDAKSDFIVSMKEFEKIPGLPIAYWASNTVREAFSVNKNLGETWYSDGPCKSGNDDIYLRNIWEVNSADIGVSSNWRPCSKGGANRKYYGNIEHVLRWRLADQRHYRHDKVARITSDESINKVGITWSIISINRTFRVLQSEDLFNSVSPTIFPRTGGSEIPDLLAFLNSNVAAHFFLTLNPTLALNVSNVLALPYIRSPVPAAGSERLMELSQVDWDTYERSLNFQRSPLVSSAKGLNVMLSSTYNEWITKNCESIKETIQIEEANNRHFIDSYGFAAELDPTVQVEQITLTINPAYRYGGDLSIDEQWIRFRQESIQELISYAIGCMMGRYSLDEPGLIYAHAGNVGFDPSRYTRFPADADGILPVTDEHWFEDDVPARISEFLQAVWGPDTLAENLAWLAESLGTKGSETPEETIRRYIADKFFKDHLQTYKKRPIYWCFSSGRQKIFQCLVYLHRYHAGTLARMRMEYVVPLQSKLAARIDVLADDIQAASSSAQAKRLQKERDKLTKQLEELRRFDEQLRHYADQRITLDLDDGVKVNYGKFGDLLAEVKTVTGTSAD